MRCGRGPCCSSDLGGGYLCPLTEPIPATPAVHMSGLQTSVHGGYAKGHLSPWDAHTDGTEAVGASVPASPLGQASTLPQGPGTSPPHARKSDAAYGRPELYSISTLGPGL